MNALVAKEIRLLVPAYGMAVLLAVLPVWMLPVDGHNSPAAASLYPFSFGAVMLALSTFGREFGLRTFPLMLAQPLERVRIWRTKISFGGRRCRLAELRCWWLWRVDSGRHCCCAR
jgi:hypothetical protein